MFGQVLRQLLEQMPLDQDQLEKVAAAAKSDKGPKYMTPRAVKRMAFQMGVVVDGNPSFKHFAKHVTGKDDLSEMNQWQLQAIARKLPHLRGAFSPMALP